MNKHGAICPNDRSEENFEKERRVDPDVERIIDKMELIDFLLQKCLSAWGKELDGDEAAQVMDDLIDEYINLAMQLPPFISKRVGLSKLRKLRKWF